MLQRVVEILSRHTQRKLSDGDVEIVPDLQIKNLYAARVARTGEYLVHTEQDRVQEVAFDEWPPR